MIVNQGKKTKEILIEIIGKLMHCRRHCAMYQFYFEQIIEDNFDLMICDACDGMGGILDEEVPNTRNKCKKCNYGTIVKEKVVER
jgi:hypothetical protein